MLKTRLVALLLAGLLATSACDSAEERAQEHFERGLALFREGDIPRAVVELRNVFQLDNTHREARLLLARIEEQRGNLPAAYGQLRAVTEQAPEDFEAQRDAGRLAAELGDWEAAGRHVEAAEALLAEGQSDPVLEATRIGVDYQVARREQDLDTARSLAEAAEALLEAGTSSIVARRVTIDDLLRRQDWNGALRALDAGIADWPGEQPFYLLRLAVLEQLGDTEAIEMQLRDLVDLFPENENFRQTLVRWYMTQGRAEDAEAYLRARAEEAEGEAEPRLLLISFLNQVRGTEAALAEAERILAGLPADDPHRAQYRSVRAELKFGLGERSAAIAEMEEIVEGAEPSDEIRRIKISLARMLVQTGNPVGARALVEEVLEEDSSQVDALKMRASWLIDDDKPDDALIELRRALDQAPRDPGILTLMALAQERAGNRNLMGEMLALAVEAANSAPEESLRYTRFLLQENRLRTAEDVLLDALRLRRGNIELLAALGDVYIRMEDWGRAQGVIDSLAGGNETALELADELTARMLSAQNRQGELQSFLERLAGDEGGNRQAVAAAVRLRMEQGDVAGALDYVRTLREDDPEDPDLRFLEASILASDDQPDAARELLRQLVEEIPEQELYWVALYRLNRRDGDDAAAEAVLDEALEALPDNLGLNWLLAGNLERDGDIEGAIAVYEKLYELNSNSSIIANNLASLITSFREDTESLERGYAIARRLRGTDVPAFQDTYGWIAARLGNHEEALEYLEPAAESLPGEPTVLFHLAETYAMAERKEEALEAYRKTLEVLEESGRDLPFRARVEDAIARLEAEI